LKQTDVDPAFKSLTIQDIKAGDILDGTIKKIEKFGVFVQLDNSILSGLCHVTEASDTPGVNLETLFKVGDKVKTFVLRLNESTKKISLSLKESNFVNNEAASANSEYEEMELDEDTEIIQEKKTNNFSAINSLSNPLDLTQSLWDHDEEKLGSDSSDDSSNENPKQKSKRQKRSEKKRQIEYINRREEELLENKAPEMPEDFERLLLGTPNSSYLWIRYMATQLNFAEIDKARKIAERALNTINFREENEKLNVWVALLNLENHYGTIESLESVFNRATQMNNPKKVYIHLAQIYERTDKLELAEELLKKMSKKFNQSCKIWIQFAMLYMKQNRADDARACLTRSITSLPKRKRTFILTQILNYF
jgi:rRNA biogenesis protein RRP5